MEVVEMASQSTRWIAIESVGPQTLRALLAGAAVAALTAYMISEPAIAHADNGRAQVSPKSAVAVFADQSPAQAVGRVMPVDDTDADDDWAQQQEEEQQEQQLQDQLQADQQMQEAEQEAEQQNELAEQEAQQAEQQGELTEQEANLQVP
jgi:nucleotide-binding universal stress UspA family protein